MNWMSPSDGEGLCVTSVGESVVPAMVEPWVNGWIAE